MAAELVRTVAPKDSRFVLTGLGIVGVTGVLLYGTVLVKIGEGRNWALVVLGVWVMGSLAFQIYDLPTSGVTGWPKCVSRYGMPLLELVAVAMLLQREAPT
jgi:hypothetical protein